MSNVDASRRHVTVLDGRNIDSDLLGGKGASLARLVRQGFPVPPVAAITTSAYRSFIRDPGLQELLRALRDETAAVPASRVDETFLAAPLPGGLEDEIRWASRAVGGSHPVAVRSSATTEDLPQLSFAGQFRSFLDVSGDVEVLRAVRLAWASLWHPAPLAYRRAWDLLDSDPAMAVLIMRMVPARLAGVVFTRDPGGDPATLRVEAVEGLAETLVSGERTPSVWLVPRQAPAEVAGLPPAVGEVSRLAIRVEEAFQRPQDIEWAWDGTRLWLVQSRPITTGPESTGDGFDSPQSSAELTTEGIAEMLPGVLPPLLWQIDSFLVEEAFRAILDDLAALPPARAEGFLHRVRGQAALDLDLLRSVAGGLPGGSAALLEEQYFGTPQLTERGTRRRRGVAGVLHDVRVALSRHRAHLEADIAVAAIQEAMAASRDPADLDDAALLAYWLRLLDLAARTSTAEMGVAASAAAAYHRLETTLTRYLKGPAAGVVQGLATGAGTRAPVEITSSRSVFGGPTWRETGATRSPQFSPSGRNRAELLASVERSLQEDPKWRRTRILTAQFVDVRIHLLRRLADDARDGLARREEVKAALLRLGGEVREVHLEFGRRLARAGMLARVEDVELLSAAELRAALAGSPPDRPTLARRRRWQARYAGEGSLPQRFVGRPLAAAAGGSPGERLAGWAASPGRYTGRARTVTHPSPDALRTGEVLVAEATDPGWTNLFVAAGAIVVERGGPLSHAAIVARELGIPAVLNLPGAAARLDGRFVTVDGDEGVVVVHSDGAGATT